MSTKSREAICSVFNEQTSTNTGDADRFASDKLISCLRDSNRRVFRIRRERDDVGRTFTRAVPQKKKKKERPRAGIVDYFGGSYRAHVGNNRLAQAHDGSFSGKY